MERRPFGKTGLEVGVLGFGGSEIGFGPATPSEIDRILNEALDSGLNVVDTGECYKDSEEKIGRAISHRRSNYFLFTKTGHASGLPEEDWDPRMMEKQIDRSLERLKTDRLDLWQLHSPSREQLERGEVIEVAQRMKAAGKTRFIGCSADNEAAIYAVECGAFDALQTSCNIADQDCIDKWLPLAEERGMGVIAKRPIANAAWLKQWSEGEYGHDYLQRLRKLDYNFLKGEPSQAIGIALRFTLSQPGVCTAIVGISKPGRFQENLRALESASLTEEEVDQIRRRWKTCREEDWWGRG